MSTLAAVLSRPWWLCAGLALAALLAARRRYRRTPLVLVQMTAETDERAHSHADLFHRNVRETAPAACSPDFGAAGGVCQLTLALLATPLLCLVFQVGSPLSIAFPLHCSPSAAHAPALTVCDGRDAPFRVRATGSGSRPGAAGYVPCMAAAATRRSVLSSRASGELRLCCIAVTTGWGLLIQRLCVSQNFHPIVFLEVTLQRAQRVGPC